MRSSRVFGSPLEARHEIFYRICQNPQNVDHHVCADRLMRVIWATFLTFSSPHGTPRTPFTSLPAAANKYLPEIGYARADSRTGDRRYFFTFVGTFSDLKRVYPTLSFVIQLVQGVL